MADGRVVLQIDQLKGSYLVAYDAANGQRVWTQTRVNGVTGGYSTPSVYEADGGVHVVVSGPLELAGYDVKDGQRKWWLRGLTNAPVSLPIVSASQVFVCEPYDDGTSFGDEELAVYDKNKDGKVTLQEVASDDSNHGLSGMAIHRLLEQIDVESGNGDGVIEAAEVQKAFRSFAHSGGLAAVVLGGLGDLTNTHVRWSYRKSLPHIVSPLLYEGVLYIINDGGVLITVHPGTGEVIKQGRLKSAGRNYFSSPVAADGKVYLLDVDGKMAVVKSGGDWEWLATGELGEPCHATPAIGMRRLYVRTETTLYCFGTE